jgi:hypothetical protein
VAGEISSNSAVSSTVSPAKNRSSTIARLSLIQSFQRLQRLVERSHINFAAIVKFESQSQRIRAAAFQTVSRDRVVSECLSHHPREDSDKVTPILPDKILLADQAKESLMHERGALKSMSGPFPPQKGLSQATQVFVNLRHHLANRGGLIALGMIRLTHTRRSQRCRGRRRGPLGANPCHNSKA